MKRWIGRYTVAVGCAHTTLGVFKFSGVLGDMGRKGVFNTARHSAAHELAFWFLMLGGALVILGLFVDWLETQIYRPPLRLGVGLVVMVAAGLVALPSSPIWLLLPPATALVLRSVSR